MLLLGLPGLLLFLQLNKGRKYLLRLLLLVGILLLLRIAASTASRAGVLTLLLYGIILFWSASGFGRLKIGAIVMIVGVVFFATAPRTTLLRYATVLPFISADPGDEGSATIVESALGSSAQRQELFQQSLDLTFHNPLFGVGPGTFESAAAKVSEKQGVQALWHQAHNTYTQVSAECGIPAFLIYVAMMVATFRAALKIRRRTAGKPGFHDLHALSLAMFMILAGFALNAAFASLAYLTTFPMLAALADGLYRTAEREIVARERSQSVVPRPSVTSKNSFRLGAKPA
jgi:O-antigen ligase